MDDLIDKRCEEEAKRRGFKDFTDWYLKSNPAETYSYIKSLAKELKIPHWMIGK